MSKNFFEEWKDSVQMTQFGALSTTFLILMVLWIASNVPEYTPQATFLFGLIIIFMVMAINDLFHDKNPILGVAHFGLNFKHSK